MTRKKAREQAFILIFEKNFSDAEIEEIIANAIEARDLINDEYALDVFRGVFSCVDSIDSDIESFLSGWTLSRISKVALAVLRLAIYEIKNVEDVPAAVSINEAVDLCKKYSSKEDSAFVNGLLGSLIKAQGN
ncbi:MAG: transcription antitermination factor NusB [bacterium]|nr:transcription antitermination factor NusB [bacterium]